MKALTATALAMALLASSAIGSAQDYPNRPLRLVVPFPAGTAADTLGRVVSQRLAEALGQPVVVDNRGGAGGILAVETVAKAAPDGYTLLLGTIGTHAINVTLYPKLGYDAVKDFSPVSLVATMPNVLVSRVGLPVESVRELIAYAKARPGQLNYASAGIGTSQHLAGELFKSFAGVDMVHVPYKGSNTAYADLMGGQVDLMFTTLVSALPQVRAGKLKGLAVASARRSALLPEVATVSEAGLPGFEVNTWFAIYAPAHTPAPVVARLARELDKLLRSEDVRKRLGSAGADAVSSTPEELAAFTAREIGKWAKVVISSGAKPQ